MVTFKNGKQIETVAVYGGTMTFQGANRETLEFRVSEENATFDELKAVYTDPEALSEIEVKDVTEMPSETGVEKVEARSLHLHYTLPVDLGLHDIDGEQLLCMKVAQKSAIEITQEQQAAAINDTQLGLIELASMIGGEDNG